jgi:hypothetical protein
MTFLEFFRTKDFPTALAKRRSKFFHIDPILKGKELRQVKTMFHMTQVPFIYDDKEVIVENNMKSPYHKRPKGLDKFERAYLKRVANIRIGLFNAKEKELKWRQESLNKRKYKGIADMLKKIMPFMIRQRDQAKNKAIAGGPSKSRKQVAESVKGVPKGHKTTRRKTKEQMKELIDSDIVDMSSMTNQKKEEANQKNKEKQQTEKKKDQRFKDEDKAVKDIQEEAEKKNKDSQLI